MLTNTRPPSGKSYPQQVSSYEALYGVVPYKAGPAFVRDAEDAIHKRGGYRLASLSEVAPPADEF